MAKAPSALPRCLKSSSGHGPRKHSPSPASSTITKMFASYQSPTASRIRRFGSRPTVRTLSSQRGGRATRSLSARGAAPSMRSCQICASTATPGRPRAIPGMARCICAPRSMSATLVEQALSDPEESLMHFYRYLGARLEELANRAGISDTARRIEGAQRLQTLSLGRGAARSRDRRHAGDRRG